MDHYLGRHVDWSGFGGELVAYPQITTATLLLTTVIGKGWNADTTTQAIRTATTSPEASNWSDARLKAVAGVVGVRGEELKRGMAAKVVGISQRVLRDVDWSVRKIVSSDKVNRSLSTDVSQLSITTTTRPLLLLSLSLSVTHTHTHTLTLTSINLYPLD